MDAQLQSEGETRKFQEKFEAQRLVDALNRRGDRLKADFAAGKVSLLAEDPTIPFYVQPFSARMPSPSGSDHSMEESYSVRVLVTNSTYRTILYTFR